MALDDYALTTVGAVESELGLASGSADAYLERQIHAYSDLFREATGRPWHRDNSYTEKVASTGDTRLFLERRPVREIDKVAIDDEEVEADGYEIEDGEAGILRRIDEPWEHTAVVRRRVRGYPTRYQPTVEVTYDGGYVTPTQAPFGADNDDADLPASIEQAIISTVATAYRRKGSPARVESESIGSASISFARPDAEAGALGEHVSPAFESAVRRHRDRSVLR